MTTNSEIYCHGKLLHTVQMAHLYPDSKTFVDMKMKKTPNETLASFNDFMTSKQDNPSPAEIKQWVESAFDAPGAEFEDWTPDDWVESPGFLKRINDEKLREFGSKLNGIWHVLGRKMIADVALNSDQYSIIPVEHPVIVPGGRFREFYYWDSYWIVQGLLHSEMTKTTRGMLENFLSIVDRFGFIPNGGRIYYSMRSQPPLLCGMVKSYVDATGDKKFAVDHVETLEREFEFFRNNYLIEVNGHQLAAYGYKSSGPRPESYREDYSSAQDAFTTEEEKQDYYGELKAAAESGMDFSSRWFIKDGTNNGTLIDLKCRSIIAVELNAILYWNAMIISEFYGLKGDLEKASDFAAKANDIKKAVDAVLWNSEHGIWLDYDLINKKHRPYFVPTNLSPLWTGCYDKGDKTLAKKVLAYIEKEGLDKYPGGVPNTMFNTGEQWDFPNVWPPMQHMLIMGLDGMDSDETKEMAFKWAERWVLGNYLAFNETNAMFEKYNAEKLGGHGGGGEYEVQLGFGWSNGAVMDLMYKYGDRLTTVQDPENNSARSVIANSLSTGILATLAAVALVLFR
ncbi:trehalase isoform X2 [Uranotaenia lowii]|uniref:trehalase isoform X2 n=1 Tax=Uranotaenia lowii TaxID=190385 RepID=UPI0024787E1F|nr:trehalase isoform X2 [Uranotaenia lowii]